MINIRLPNKICQARKKIGPVSLDKAGGVLLIQAEQMTSSMLLKEELIRYSKHLGASRAHPILVRMIQYPRHQGLSTHFLSMLRVPGCCEERATGRRKLERKKIWKSLGRAGKSFRVPEPWKSQGRAGDSKCGSRRTARPDHTISEYSVQSGRIFHWETSDHPACFMTVRTARPAHPHTAPAVRMSFPII